MPHLYKWLLLCLFPLLVQCSSPYGPDCAQYDGKDAPTQEQLVAQARSCWETLKNKRKEADWPRAAREYNRAVYALVESMRCDDARLGIRSEESHSRLFAFSHGYSARQSRPLYETVIPSDKIELERLKEKITVPGIGVPLAGRTLRDRAQNIQAQLGDISGIHTLTAILDFDRKTKGLPTFRLVPRLKENFVRIGRQRHHLAADFSAPIDYFWSQAKIDDYRILGLFRPSEAINTMGLFFMEPYDPDKIPVIFTHGLQSSPDTFSNLTNRLLAYPEIRKNYQFWFFGYPTGMPWVSTAAQFREEINRARARFDPSGKDRNFDKMVLVGHSMGGLITRYSISQDSWKLLKYALKESERGKLDRHYMRSHMSREEYEKLSPKFDFTPLSYPKRAVFLATPHRGSDFADNWIGRLAIALISLPQDMVKELYNIATLNKNILLLNPERIADDFTSISQLSPKNPTIKGLDPLRPSPKLPVHSIIGDRGKNNTPDSSDGIVAYSSSHLDWAASEKIVAEDHSVQEHADTAGELYRILREHLRQNGQSRSLQFTEGQPAPSSCLPAQTGEKNIFRPESYQPAGLPLQSRS